MANTYTQIYIQIVFAVQSRQCLIPRDHKDELYKYTTGIIKKRNQKLIAIDGMQDHLHVFIGMNRLLRFLTWCEISRLALGFVNERRWIREGLIGKRLRRILIFAFSD